MSERIVRLQVASASRLPQRILTPAVRQVDFCQVCANSGTQRIQHRGPLRWSKSSLRTPQHEVQPTQPVVCLGVARPELDATFQLPEGFQTLLTRGMDDPQRDVGFSQRAVELQRASCRLLRAYGDARIGVVVELAQGEAVGQTNPGEGVARILCDSSLEVIEPASHSVFRPPVEQFAAPSSSSRP